MGYPIHSNLFFRQTTVDRGTETRQTPLHVPLSGIRSVELGFFPDTLPLNRHHSHMALVFSLHDDNDLPNIDTSLERKP